MRYQRIMHLTDLHLGSSDRDSGVDNKARFSRQVVSGLSTSPERQFLEDLRRWRARHTEGEERPQLLVVSGDVVNRGGISAGGGTEAWDRAREFLESVQTILNLPNDHVLVVPGNHDVDFHAASRDSMFQLWNQAMSGYERPRLCTNGRFEAHRCRIEGLVEGQVVTIVLLSSPCYVGDTNPGGGGHAEHDEFLYRLESLFSEVDDDLRQRIIDELRATRGRLDIAAIGAQQRRHLQDLGPKEPNEVRIAVLHHHLLPDPQIEITQFEAVVDAGETLAVLTEAGFDLVLSGHKHHRHLTTITDGPGRHPLHVYTGHSLFEAGRTPPGVSLIDLWAPTDPLVATIRFLERNLDERPDLVLDLERPDYVNPQILRICQSVDAERQQDVLLPVLTSLAQSLGRLAPGSSYAKVEELFGHVLGMVRDDLDKLGRGTMVLRPPNLARDWATLVKAVETCDDRRIRMVSDNDLTYWLRSLDDDSEPSAYSEALRGASHKERILILRRNELSSGDASRVIDHLLAEGYRVYTIPYEDVDNATWTDFAILGDLGVGRFLGPRDGSMVRALEENFDPSDVQAAEAHWQELIGNPKLRPHERPA